MVVHVYNDFFSKPLFSKTNWPIIVKLHVVHSCIEGTNVCSMYLGHMTNMTVMPIYGKNL